MDKINLGDLNGKNGFAFPRRRRLPGINDAGDVNGDGIDDLIIGEPKARFDKRNQGEAYVVFGNNTGFFPSLSDLNGSNGFILRGINKGDNLGFSVSDAGDINSDGIDDIIIGAPGVDAETNNQGEIYVVFGSNESFDAEFDLTSLNGSNGFILRDINKGDNLGFSVSDAGDINGDGIDDILIGTTRNRRSRSEKAYIVFGRNEGFSELLDLDSLDGTNGFTINISRTTSILPAGLVVSSAGDVNDDGIDDFIIGAADSSKGKSYVVFGNEEGFAAEFDINSLDGNNGFIFEGSRSGDQVGFSVSSAGDVNGDGIDDLIIGAPGAGRERDQGEVYVIFGSNTGFRAKITPSDINRDNGFVVEGIDVADQAGYSVSGAVDINGDGIDDVFIQSPFARGLVGDFRGEEYVIFGTRSLELIGTEEDDILTGGSGGDLISGLGGNDLLEGDSGSDEILGGSGNDLILGGTDNDTLMGQEDNDNIFGNQGNDSIFGGLGADRLIGGTGSDEISGGAADDFILGGTGDDLLKGNLGNDQIASGNGADTVRGGLGNDILEGDLDNDLLNGGADNDTITGGMGNDSLKGGSGDDLLMGINATESDLTFGLREQDILTGGEGSDIFVLGNESNVFYDDGDALTDGVTDFALITDFDASQDTIQLNGTADLYSLDFFTSGTGTIDARLIFDPGVTAFEEVIAILENVDASLSIDDSAFSFV